MRFWITKNSELPVREQLVRQVVLGILSQDLPPGHKLPSVRALARRHHIHANTVSAAYHDLLQQGWVELRPGSGVYVRAQQSPTDGRGELDRLLTTLLQSARSQGYEPEEVFERLKQLVRPRTYGRVLIVEPEAAMREILRAELAEHLSVPVEAVETPDMRDSSNTVAPLVVHFRRGR
jgi:DNA-binding transcriptional regulator YhcF (GntR family)